MNRRRCLVKGVYVVSVELDGEHYRGVANVGSRPTVAGSGVLLEVHLFDFNRDIYGQRVAVSFHRKLREEQRFDSFDALKQQIEIDVIQAREFFQE
jgi:riboflavin kinase/FMN adenylyltransferase